MTDVTYHTPYSIKIRKQYHDTLQLIISGELDETNADVAFETIEHNLEEKNTYKHIACDFSQLTYTNSKTLGYLTDMIARTHRKGKTISFDRVHPKTQYIFDMIGLSKVTDAVV
jgi:anti-anti-sigma factor